jgi:hypothetical protein
VLLLAVAVSPKNLPPHLPPMDRADIEWRVYHTVTLVVDMQSGKVLVVSTFGLTSGFWTLTSSARSPERT